MEAITCPKCQVSTNAAARFCPQCGWELTKSYSRINLGVNGLLITLVVGVGLWAAGSALQSAHTGVKPTRPYQADSAPAVNEPDPELDALRKTAQEHSDQISSLQPLANALLERLRTREDSPPALILEATDVLGQILRVDPKDREALIALGDISFNQKVFDQAVGLYERYLTLEPRDSSARSRYASSLAFVGKTPQAIQELQAVLKDEPNNFHALAYLSITYAQSGDTAHALEIGQKALKNSPSPEATSRFNEFLTALAAQKKSPADSGASAGEPSVGGVAELANFVAGNPVAGPKYVRFESSSADTLRFYFRNFPMGAMPPMAKTRFYSGIKQKADELQLKDLKKIIFLDADSGKELDTLSIE